MTTDDVKRKLSAILSADVKGYSRLMQDDEEATVRTITQYREVMTNLIQANHGRVLDAKGDNVLADFPSVVASLRSAVEIQKEIKKKNSDLPENRRMEFRIGINLGDVIEQGDTIYGDGVNIAARLEGLASEGGICISKAAFDQVKNKLNLGYKYLGEHSVKNIAEPVPVYRVLLEPEYAGRVLGGEITRPKKSRRWFAVAAAAIVIVLAALGIWNFHFRQPTVEPASKEKMVYPLPNKPSIAVLPFANMTGDSGQEYMVDGLTETIITALARVPQLFVIARNSTFVYKGKGVRVQQVAEELGIQYVLEGSVQRSGDKVRITAQFIDALNGRHMWAAQYDRQIKDLFLVTDEVTRKVLMGVYVKVTGREEAQLSRRKAPKNTEALLKTFEVIAAMRGLNPKDNAQAKRLAEELTAMDPDYSIGYTLLSRAYYMDVVLGSSNSPKESLAKALELAQKAVAMDKFEPTNYDTLGYVYSLMRQHEQALVEFEKASELCPSCSDPYMYIGFTQYCMDETEKAIASLQTALRLNPYPPSYYYLHLGNAYRHARRYEDAVSWYQKALQISPNAQGGLVGLVTSYSLLGREEAARSAAKELLRVNPKFSVEHYAKTIPYKDQDKVVRFANALRKEGLN
jgi:adenylate cyclase